jgi:hypothetical protein
MGCAPDQHFSRLLRCTLQRRMGRDPRCGLVRKTSYAADRQTR